MSPASSPNVKPSSSGSGTPPTTASTRADVRTASGSSNSGARNASFKKSEEEVFTIDDDEGEEQDDFVGGDGGSSRTSSSSSARNESFNGHNGATGDASSAALVLHSVEKGHVGVLKKGMRVSRVQMLPCVESPFFSGYKKKKTDARVSMLPRRLVIAENHLVVLKTERNLDDVYMVKSCHTLSHIVRMTCLKKNALMVTVYYKWKRADTGETIEKRNFYEVQQRDEFVKAIRGAMEKIMSDKKRESMASKIDEVAKNQIWREQLKTEYIMESALTSFQFNPTKLSSITQKPTRTHPADFGQVHEDKDTEALGKRTRCSRQ
ncbi:hypothetical protein FI667_g1345, partial [Globisporangium splendens]